MHILSARNRDEFLAVPQLIRFEYADGQEDKEPTLLVKGTTLLLKYIALGARTQLAFAECEGRLLYAMRIFDDGDDAGTLWSVVERQEELDAIRAMATGQSVVAFLFNEIAVNVAETEFASLGVLSDLIKLVENASLGRVDHQSISRMASKELGELYDSNDTKRNWVTIEISQNSDWIPLQNHFITASAQSSLIDLFDHDEGNQQEQIGIWLTDNLHPLGAYHSPQRPYKESETRELTDVLLNYEFGATFIESKTLSVFARESLPERIKLKRNVSSHITKAFKQLRGGIRHLRDGVKITNCDGNVLTIDRKQPVHAIVLVPEFDLVENRMEYGREFITKFMSDTGGFPHVLDISELLRVVQAAEMIAEREQKTTTMMAFDYYLMERLKKAIDAKSLCIEVLLRIEKSEKIRNSVSE